MSNDPVPDQTPLDVKNFTLDELIPHRGTMLLLGEVVAGDCTHAITLSRVSSAWPMADVDGVSPLICVELAAQTAGVCNGLERIEKSGIDSDQMGWLVAVKRADFFIEHLPLGMSIITRADNSLAFDKFREVTSQLHHGDTLLAEVVLQLYQV